jgi:hypothetical protein
MLVVYLPLCSHTYVYRTAVHEIQPKWYRKAGAQMAPPLNHTRTVQYVLYSTVESFDLVRF